MNLQEVIAATMTTRPATGPNHRPAAKPAGSLNAKARGNLVLRCAKMLVPSSVVTRTQAVPRT